MFSKLDSYKLIDRGNEDFVNYLGTEECQRALERDRISIHVPTGSIFVNNENTGESLYSFLENQQDETKKEIPLDFTYDDDLTNYMTRYLTAINDTDEVKNDFLTNKNSKYLFHLFNKYQENRGRPKYPIRHSNITADDYALKTLQEQNWPYFINRIIEHSQGFLDINEIVTTDPNEINILNDTRANFEIVKNLYNELFPMVGVNLHEYFKNLDINKKQKIDQDLTNNNFFTWDPQETYIQDRILRTNRDFYYETGRFPGRNSLVPVPMANMPIFVNSKDWISPPALYETFVGRDMQDLVSVQFLAAFNKFWGGDKEISRIAMSEFFHNLSWQALTKDNDSIKIEFEAITELVKSINHLLQKKIYKSKRKTLRINKELEKTFSNNQPETIQTKNEVVEQKIVTDIVNNNDTDYTPRYIVPTIKTEEQIDQDRVRENTDYIATELAKRERDIQIIEDISNKNQVYLIRSIVDPGEGIMTNKDVSLTDYNRNDNNEPIQPQLEPGVLNVMKEMAKIMSEQVISIYDDMPALEDVPESDPPAILPPSLQDILTNDTQNENVSDLIQIKDEITDVLGTIVNADNNDDKPQIAPAAILIDDNDSDGETIPYVGEYDGGTIPYVGESDGETIPYVGESDGETIPFVGESDGETIPYVGESDGETIPYVGESDSETIPYLGGSDTESVVYAPPYRNRKETKYIESMLKRKHLRY